MAWKIVQLSNEHDRTAFGCGVVSLDDFLQKLATQYEKRDCGRTYVLVRDGDNRVYGYYTIAAAGIPREEFPSKAAKKLPKHPIPIVILARLAVDQSVKGQGRGRELLGNALGRIREIAEQLGVHAVFVDAIDESASEFYKKHGFTPLPGDALKLFMAVSAIGKP